MRSLIVVAHPDDEVLWFSSVLLRDTCDVICVTCGHDLASRAARSKRFHEAAALTNVQRSELLYFDDSHGRLNLEHLEQALEPFTALCYERVYTHSPSGDTHDHNHHQDVSYIVHRLFGSVHCTAWNIYPDYINTLTVGEYWLKKYILGTLYAEEYRDIRDAYEISAIEKFVMLEPTAVEIYYWAIANFGDHHERLAVYRDFWGFEWSPYEIERHCVIEQLAREVSPKSILEFGAAEGVLAKRLRCVAPVTCVERVSAYATRLGQEGFAVVTSPQSGDYELSVLASVLEYMDDPAGFLDGLRSRFLVVDVTTASGMRELSRQRLDDRYQLISEVEVRPRWERMYCGAEKLCMETYRLGATVALFRAR